MRSDTTNAAFRADTKSGHILAPEELKLWRHTYGKMKGKTRAAWESVDNLELLEQQYLCFDRLELATRRAKISLEQAFEMLINKRKGAIKGMAKFL